MAQASYARSAMVRGAENANSDQHNRHNIENMFDAVVSKVGVSSAIVRQEKESIINSVRTESA